MIRSTHRSALAILATCIAWIASAHAVAANAAERPNFVLILADDLGYGDVACYGHEVVQTPNIDRLAGEGVRFTDCYSAGASCSPSRFGLMTGRTPYRGGIHGHIPWGMPMHMQRSEVTVATVLRQTGYATCHAGKWHLNGRLDSKDQPSPAEHGFDHWFSTQNNALPNHKNPNNFFRNGEPVGALEGYSADLVAAEAATWLRDVRPKDRPFFLYVCFHEPHEPINADPRHASQYDYPDEPSRAAYYGSITQLDAGVGHVLRALDELELRDSTFVLFTSDNGPANTRYHPHGSSGPLRAKKGEVYEGGIRVPCMVRWPGHVTPGTVCSEPICGVDFLPTVCAICGLDAPSGRTIDGASILAAIVGERPITRREPLYWQYNRAPLAPKVAMRVGDWKILATLGGAPMPPRSDITEESMRILKTAEIDRFELYNLRDDVGETRELSRDEPERFAEMKALLQKKYHEVRDESPVWPPMADPGYEAQHIEWSTYEAKDEG